MLDSWPGGLSTRYACYREEPDMTFYPWPSWEGERGNTQYTSSSQVWPVTSPSLLFLWRQLIPTCTQRLGSAEWPKWLQSSWPRRLTPAEWSSLCPHGHRGLAELGCFLRGHLAGLCSYPSNAGTGISTWSRGGLVLDWGNVAYKVMTCLSHPVTNGASWFKYTHEPKTTANI